MYYIQCTPIIFNVNVHVLHSVCICTCITCLSLLFIVCNNGDVRLVGGAHQYEGTVEVCVDKSWSLVAEHGWDDADARIVCKQIGGYNYSGTYTV